MNEETFNLIRRMYETLTGASLPESVTTANVMQIVPVLLDSFDLGTGPADSKGNPNGLSVPLGESVTMKNAIRRVLQIEQDNRAISLKRRVDALIGTPRKKRS